MPNTIVVTKAVIDQILKKVCSGLAKAEDGRSVEVSGLLLGREATYSLLVTSIAVGDQLSTEFESRLDERFLAGVVYDIAKGRIKDRIVGMFHSHPGFGIFMSEQDIKTLVNFQRLYSRFVMMVVDPLTELRYVFFTYDVETGSVCRLQVELI